MPILMKLFTGVVRSGRDLIEFESWHWHPVESYRTVSIKKRLVNGYSSSSCAAVQLQTIVYWAKSEYGNANDYHAWRFFLCMGKVKIDSDRNHYYGPLFEKKKKKTLKDDIPLLDVINKTLSPLNITFFFSPYFVFSYWLSLCYWSCWNLIKQKWNRWEARFGWGLWENLGIRW